MNKIIILTVLIVSSSITHLKAQTKSLEIETDPTSFFNGGYNFNLGYSIPHWAFRLTSVKAVVPEFSHGNEGFDQEMLGVAFNLDFFVKENNNGFFLGSVSVYSKDELTNPVKNKLTNEQLSFGLRTGFRIMPFKKQKENQNGFYITPFISPVFVLSNDAIFIDNSSFKYKSFQIWGGVHVGWRINVLK